MRRISRRDLSVGVFAAAGAAALGAGWLRFFHPLRRHYPPTPYDDLLARLDDRETAARLGKSVIAGMPGFDLRAVAARLRARLGTRGIGDAVQKDLDAGALNDVGGWLLPESLALLCAVAAGAQSGTGS